MKAQFPSEVKSHPWLKNYNWDRLSKRETEPSFFPGEDVLELNQSAVNGDFDDENSEILKQNAILLRRNSIQGLFNGYNFDHAMMQNMPKDKLLQPYKGSSMTKIDGLSSSFSNQTTQSISAQSPVEMRG